MSPSRSNATFLQPILFVQTATLLAPQAVGLGHASQPVARSRSKVELWPLGLAGKELQTHPELLAGKELWMTTDQFCLPASNFD